MVQVDIGFDAVTPAPEFASYPVMLDEFQAQDSGYIHGIRWYEN
jgi:hypothetical protein